MSLYLNLNVDYNASQDDIKSAYKQLSLKYHPDKNPEGKDIFQEIDKSYKILRNENLRIIYDLGKLEQYLNIKDKILEQLNDNIINNILNLVNEKQVTSKYTLTEFEQDLRNKDLDKIIAILLKAYYCNDKVFKFNYINIGIGIILGSSLFWMWNKTKQLAPYVITGITLYYNWSYLRGLIKY